MSDLLITIVNLLGLLDKKKERLLLGISKTKLTMIKVKKISFAE